jgi:hypothetical protein
MSSPAQTLRSWVRIPFEAWMSVCILCTKWSPSKAKSVILRNWGETAFHGCPMHHREQQELNNNNNKSYVMPSVLVLVTLLLTGLHRHIQFPLFKVGRKGRRLTWPCILQHENTIKVQGLSLKQISLLSGLSLEQISLLSNSHKTKRTEFDLGFVSSIPRCK